MAQGVLLTAVFEGLQNAAWLSLIGVALMFGYMSIHLKSLILTFAALAGVVLSFPVTWAIYSVLLQIRYMGMLNFMALFIIVGIGVVGRPSHPPGETSSSCSPH